MSFLNENVKGKEAKLVENEEGYEIYKENPYLEMMKMASNLRPRGAFYKTEVERVTTFVDMVKAFKDEEYLKALAHFMNSEMGIRFSPVVITTLLNKKLTGSDRKKLVTIFDRPDKVALAFGIAKHYGFKMAPTFKKKVLKTALEGMKPLSLKKMKMPRRAIKLKDVIKILHPKPKDKALAEMYKAIIEGSKLSKLTKTESVVAAKSDTTISDEEKIKLFIDALDTMPINMFIRNLRFYEQLTYTQKKKVKDALVVRLTDMLDSDNDRILNPFDLVTTAMEVPSLGDELNEALRVFIEKAKKRSGVVVDGRTLVLFDVSGSMSGTGVEEGLKYLAILTHYLNLNEGDLWCFDNRLYDANYQGKVIEAMKKGRYAEARDRFQTPGGGTSLLECSKELLGRFPECKNLVIISDEQTWDESEGIDSETKYVREIFKGRIIAINPVNYQGTVFKDKYLAIASLDAKIFYFLQAMLDFPAFVKMLKQRYAAIQ